MVDECLQCLASVPFILWYFQLRFIEKGEEIKGIDGWEVALHCLMGPSSGAEARNYHTMKSGVNTGHESIDNLFGPIDFPSKISKIL